MGIFDSKSKHTGRTSRRSSRGKTAPEHVTIIGVGTVFDGSLRAEGDVRISGRLKGRLQVEGRVLIAENGMVEGEVAATTAEIAGRVDGEVRVGDRLVLRTSARIDGDLHAGRLVVEDGAQFSGQCIMSEEEGVSSIDRGGEKTAKQAKEVLAKAAAKNGAPAQKG